MLATLFFGGWDIPFMTADNSGPVSVPARAAVGIIALAKLLLLHLLLHLDPLDAAALPV
jgi:NADH:ubiquinone oxidoreductase subunit H